MRARWSLIALALAACTRPTDANPDPSPAPPAPIAAPPAAPIAPPAAPPDPTIIVPLPVAPSGSLAAFVVATRHTTIVLPVDPALPLVEAPGLWLLDDAVPDPVVRFYPALAADFPRCACPETPAKCDGPITVPPAGGPLCECVDRPPADEPAADASCITEDPHPPSLVGGQLYFHVDTHDGCEGMNIYDIESTSEPLVATPADLSRRTMPQDGCRQSDTVTTAEPAWPLPVPECDAAALAASVGCELCREMPGEAVVFTLHRGRLFRVEDEMDTSGADLRRWSSIPVDPTTCPTAADPCGSPDAFPGIDAADDFWISSDRSHALRLDGDRLSLLGSHTPLTRGVARPQDLLGVRWHPDAHLLVATMQARAPRPRPLPTCDLDVDCAGYPGRSLRCSAGACLANAAPVTAELAPEDRDFKDTRGGRGWGDRCVVHLRAAQYAHALAACDAGLALATAPTTRGALLYNLGVIARRTGDVAAARARWRESLAARPGNPAVTAALAELGPG